MEREYALYKGEEVLAIGTIDYEGEISIHEDEMIAFFSEYDMNKVYFATREQYQGKGTSIYIVDPEGANQVKENVKDAEIVTISLVADETKRRYRLIDRVGPFRETMLRFVLEDEETVAAIDQVKDRIKLDSEIFSVIKCDYAIDANRELEEVLEDIVQVIGG